MRLSLLSKISIAAILAVGAIGGVSLVYGDKLSALTLVPPPEFAPLPKQPAGVPFPTKEWPIGTLDVAQKSKLDAAIDKAFDNSAPALGETRAILVVKGGKIIAEKYGEGFNKDSKLNSWSMAKSITSALFAIAMGDGKLSLDTKIQDPHWRSDDARNEITYRDALHMTDGLNWREKNYADPLHNDAAIMLFGKGREDVVKYVTSRPKKHESGKVWNYSSGTTNLISAGISRSLGPRTPQDPNGSDKYRNFMFKNLFHAIGMNDTAPEFDAAGNFYAGSLVQASARDFARFGLLHLRDGVWDGKRILPEGWVSFIRTPTKAEGAEAYGAHWWLSPPDKSGLLKNGPYDSFEAQGHDGQVIAIIPSKDLVIVRLGLSPDKNAWPAIGDYISSVANSAP